MLQYRCYAKINLTLEIIGKRPDGFHELSSLVHTISLADDLLLEPADALLIRVEGLDIDPEVNLVSRAAALLATTLQQERGASMTLVKRIPAAAGLGGGSCNAAATLVGLNSVWDAQLSTKQLCELAAQLGSDVPFFLRGGAALMRGRGDELQSLPPCVGQWLLLLVPPHAVQDKTRRLYAALEPGDFTDGTTTRATAGHLRRRASLDEVKLVNGFERAARHVFPGLDDTWHAAERLTEKRFCLSGAGPSLFTFAANQAEARRLAKSLKTSLEVDTLVARTVKHARASLRRPAIGYA
jgi:4-diphosphocytidyl-2-C-methyl-D-erythritol kinase